MIKYFPPHQSVQESKLFNLKKSILENYNLNIVKNESNSNKTKLLFCQEGKCFILKEVDADVSKIFEFLESLGISNVILPNTNNNNQFISKTNNKYYYISNYYRSNETMSERKATDLFYELTKLHELTAVPRKMEPKYYRNKFDELSKRLDYTFKKIEEYVRGLESKKINSTSYQILERYYIILNAKQELSRLQKKLILSIKDEESVNYTFIHNDPKLDHLLYVRGNKYLVSLEKGKMGILSLDLAKFYVENSNLKIDLKTLICDELFKYDTDFYYDYFRFVVILIYIFRINITNELVINVQSFIINSDEIEKFMKNFVDRVRTND